MLQFNHNKYTFFTIYDSIKEYYPIGLPRQNIDMFLGYPGQKKLEKILIENIHLKNGIDSQWEILNFKIEQRIKKPLIKTTYGQAPCYSSRVVLKKTLNDNLARFQELSFFVSLVGKYYSVIGIDRNEITYNEKIYHSSNYLIVSPEGEYLSEFRHITNLIEQIFVGFRFVPFGIAKQHIEGLCVRYLEDLSNCIFYALFNSQINVDIQTVGDECYQYESWIDKDYIDDGKRWTSYPPQ